MSKTWTITAGERTFEVPRLPLRISRNVYPACQRLTNAGLVERLIRIGDGFAVDEAEMADLVEIAFQCCQAADRDLTREAFDDLPVTPPQLFDAFFAARSACGGWKPIPQGEGQEDQGEGEGAMPPTSTSSESSPA